MMMHGLHAQLGKTMIYVTHDQIEAMTLATKIVVMNKGDIQQIGTPHEVYYCPANLFVARFVGSPTLQMFAGTLASGADGVVFDDGRVWLLPFAAPTGQWRAGRCSWASVPGILRWAPAKPLLSKRSSRRPRRQCRTHHPWAEGHRAVPTGSVQEWTTVQVTLTDKASLFAADSGLRDRISRPARAWPISVHPCWPLTAHFWAGRSATKTRDSMAIQTILGARRIVVLATGASKAQAVRGILEQSVTAAVPGSALHLANDVTLVLDQAAARA